MNEHNFSIVGKEDRGDSLSDKGDYLASQTSFSSLQNFTENFRLWSFSDNKSREEQTPADDEREMKQK